MVQSLTTIALVGNPNTGKTTLFNGLTGSRQQVANWPGVTVVRKEGYFECGDHCFKLVDLPGTYGLTHVGTEAAPDTQLTAAYLSDEPPDLIINVVNANHLERHLYLTMQLLEMGLPMLVVLNMADEAKKQGRVVNPEQLSQALGCPVFTMIASQRIGLDQVRHYLCQARTALPMPKAVLLSRPLHEACEAVLAHWPALQRKPQGVGRAMALRLLEGDGGMQADMPVQLAQQLPGIMVDLRADLEDDIDVVIADQRYQRCATVVSTVMRRDDVLSQPLSARIDAWVLHRWWGIPIFLAVMYCLFVITMGVSGIFQDLFDWGSEALLVQGMGHWLASWHAPPWLHWVLPQGVGRGLNTAFSFIPVLFTLFFMLGLLDQSGYMARGAMVVDRVLRRMGLPGQSFVPMIVGFGCNVPAVMATRTLRHQRERIVTILMTPFMSCGARLAIFAVFTAAFFRHGGAFVIFALYCIGILVALLTGWVLHRTLLCGQPIPFIMELPPYRVPTVWRVGREAVWRLKRFLWRAVKVIVPVCIMLSVLGQVDIAGHRDDHPTQSVMVRVGQGLTHVLKPMGVQEDNWPAAVGLLTGVLAKEVVIGTLNSLYDQLHGATTHRHTMPAQPREPVGHQWRAQWSVAWRSVGQNLWAFPKVLSHPLSANAPLQRMDPVGTGEMIKRFASPEAAFAYMLAVLLYFPCISTLAAMVREMHRGWAYFSVVWSFLMAYVVAVLFYQTATVAQHPMQTLMWWAVMLGALAVVFVLLRVYGRSRCATTRT